MCVEGFASSVAWLPFMMLDLGTERRFLLCLSNIAFLGASASHSVVTLFSPATLHERLTHTVQLSSLWSAIHREIDIGAARYSQLNWLYRRAGTIVLHWHERRIVVECIASPWSNSDLYGSNRLTYRLSDYVEIVGVVTTM
jgi:hypothetical protein